MIELSIYNQKWWTKRNQSCRKLLLFTRYQENCINRSR